MSASKRTSSTWRSWWSMISRCIYPSASSSDYSAIKVCDRWMTFENFLADMGERPDGMTIDRFPDRAGNYEPTNCRWATPVEQSQNRRSSVLSIDSANEAIGRFEHGQKVSAISRIMKIGYGAIWDAVHGRSWPQLDRPYL